MIGDSAGELVASVLIVSFNDEEIIADCLASVFDQDFDSGSYEVIVVDNDSRDLTTSIIERQFPAARLVKSEINLGYPAGMNEALRAASGRYAVMLSSDTVVPPGWLRALLEPMQQDTQIKVTHAAMVIPGDPEYQGFESRLNGRVSVPTRAAYHEMSPAGLIVPQWASSNDSPVPTLHVAGASAALDLSILEELGGYMLDGEYFLDCDEIDLGFRVNNLGYRVVAVPAAAYYHRHPFNTQMKLTPRLVRRLIRLQHNKAVTFYKNMHALEFLLCLPILLIGGAFKPLVYGERFSIGQKVLSILGLELFVWTGFLSAALGSFRNFSEKRRHILERRRRPSFWFFKALITPLPRTLS